MRMQLNVVRVAVHCIGLYKVLKLWLLQRSRRLRLARPRMSRSQPHWQQLKQHTTCDVQHLANHSVHCMGLLLP